MSKDLLSLPADMFVVAPYSLILATARFKDFKNLYYDTEAEVSTTVDKIKPYCQFIHFSEVSCGFKWPPDHQVLTINLSTGNWRWRVAYEEDYP